MNIYCQYSHCKTLKPTKGDFINEINFLMALSGFANVFYSGQKFDPSKPEYGLREYPGEIHNNIPKNCDVYYIRANRKVFDRVPGGRPKMWMAAPFDDYCYDHATYIATFTSAWARKICEGYPFYWNPPQYLKPRPNVVNINQVVSGNFRYGRNRRSREIRKSTAGDFVIGHFGRIVRSDYPFAFLSVLPGLIKKYPGIKFLVGTSGKLPSGLPNTIVTKFSHDDVPNAISACDIILMSNWNPEWEICGSGKAIEAAACGVPVVLGRSEARTELFCNDYPLFVPTLSGDADVVTDAANLLKLLDLILNNREMLIPIGQDLVKRADFYSISNSVNRLNNLFTKIAAGHQLDDKEKYAHP